METKTENRKAIAMLSGGLDSRLAVKMVQEQGIEVTALHYVTPFCNCTSKSSCKLEAKKASEEYGINLKTFYVFDEFIEIIKNPKYGYGSGINPCLDCRILMFRKAKEFMGELGASFVVTGEVLGERPMSQRLDAINIIERESGLSGLIVRPLSAKLFEPSLPEKNGWVDRRRFMNISGRSRKPQIKLADEMGIIDYPCPAGGCLLTDKDFSARLRYLLDMIANPSRNDVFLLKVGRHRFLDNSRLVIGRNERENRMIGSLSRKGDILMEVDGYLGPTTLIRGAITDEIIKTAADATAGYSKARMKSSAIVCYRVVGQDKEKKIEVKKDIVESAVY